MARLTIPDEQTFAEFTVVTSTSAFPITFSLFAKADLTVIVDGTALTQSDFTFAGTLLDGGGYDGGTVTLNTAVDDVTVRIERNVAPARTSNFAPAASTPVGSVDQALNRLTAVQQDIDRRQSVFDDLALDAAQIAADAAQTAADRIATAADVVAAEADRVATAADRVQTTADRAVTTADKAVTTADRIAAAASAVAADTDADRADAAANVATAISRMYPDKPTGLAATANGGYFSVEPDTNGDIVICRDDSGTATEVGSVFALVEDHKSRRQVPPRLLGNRSQGLKLRKALSDIRSGTRKSLKIMALGDSLVGISWSTVHVQLMKELEGWMTSTPIYAHSLGVLGYGTFSDSAAATASSNSTTGTDRQKLDYDAAWDGSLVWLDAGQAARWAIGGNAVQADKIYIPIIREPGAGTVKIELSSATAAPALGGAYVNVTAPQITSGHSLTGSELLVSASGTFGVEMVTLSVALGPWTVKVSHSSGGRVRVRAPMHEVSTAAAFNVWRVGSASNDYGSTLASAATIEAGQIAAYDPDIIVVETDDRLAAYQNFLPLLETAITNAGLTHNPLVLLVINPFYDNPPNYSDADIIERADYCHNFAATRLGWDVLDGIAMSGGLDEATAAGYENDGIHYSDQIARWMTKTWLASRGYLPSQPQGGGYAGAATALKGPVSAANGSQRPLIAGNIPALLLQSTAFDTSTCGWAGTASGSGSYARGNAGDITITTGSTASSGVGAFINQNGSMLGIISGNPRGESRGFAVRIRTSGTWDTQALAFILQRTDAVAWNSGYNGTLTAAGWGFRVSNDGTNTLIHGICWLNGALVVSSTSAILGTGGSSAVKDLAVLCTPEAINSSRGTLEWFVTGVSLGTSNYDHSGTFLNVRAEITNGSTATSRNLLFMPPKYLSAPW